MRVLDLVVIGAGPGGYVAAIRAAQKGLKTAIVESGDVGGTCLNRGCIPTKSMVHSAQLYKKAAGGAMFGLVAKEVGFDFDVINARKMEAVEKLRTGTEHLLKTHKVQIIRGRATVTGLHRVSVATDAGEEGIEAGNIIVATGSRPALLPDAMQHHTHVITTDEALSKDAKLYKRILISGGGVIGVEFASIYNALGCEVTIVGSRENLLRRLDPEISKNLMLLFKKRGISIITPGRIQDIKEDKQTLLCQISHNDEMKEVACDGVLVCIGRRPVTEGIFGEGLDVEMDNGYIVVNESMQTNIPHIYAIGDCTLHSTQLAHAASAQGLNAVAHITGESPASNMRAVPGCIYTDPEISTAGLTENEAIEQGYEVKTGKYLMGGNGESVVTNEDRGFIKLVFDAKTDVILGAHLMCARATDIITELTCAIANKLTAQELTSVIRPHPTYAEGITEAAEDYFGLAVHMAPKKR